MVMVLVNVAHATFGRRDPFDLGVPDAEVAVSAPSLDGKSSR